jgi:predicted membrane-bound dolichyl-phosphate-mannose-protein mannosyltransferase
VATLALAVFGATCLVVGTFIALRDRTPRAAGWLAWSLMLGFASLAALAFSPTVYASGERTRFALCAVLMIVLCRLIAEARERLGDAWLRFAAIPLAAVVVLRVLQTA